jgi:peptidoglycan hydrolase CwlO-like protein
MEAKFNNTDQEVLSIKNSIETINSNIQQQTLDITGLNDRLNGLEEQIANKVTTRDTTDGLKSGQYVFLKIEE